jgi:hypothetical protein
MHNTCLVLIYFYNYSRNNSSKKKKNVCGVNLIEKALKTDVLYSANFLKIHITFRGNGKIFLQILLQNLYNVKVGNIGY